MAGRAEGGAGGGGVVLGAHRVGGAQACVAQGADEQLAEYVGLAEADQPAVPSLSVAAV